MYQTSSWGYKQHTQLSAHTGFGSIRRKIKRLQFFECEALGLTQFQLQGISHHPLASASTAFACANPQTCTYAGPYRLYLWNKPGSLSTVRGQTLAAACARSALPQTPRGFLLLHPVLPGDVTSCRSCSGHPPHCSAPHTASCSSQLSCEEGFPSPLRSCLVQSGPLVSS